MQEELNKAMLVLLGLVAANKSADDVLKISQAVLNIANAKIGLKQSDLNVDAHENTHKKVNQKQ